MNDKGLEMLRMAILKKAANDYITALRCNDPHKINKLERFFKSDWGELLSGGYGDYIVSECRKRAR